MIRPSPIRRADHGLLHPDLMGPNRPGPKGFRDLEIDIDRRRLRERLRLTRSVKLKDSAPLAFLAMGRSARILVRFPSPPRYGPGPAIGEPIDDQHAAVNGSAGITLEHEKSRTVMSLRQATPRPGFSSHQADTPATNVLSRYA
jgi:hypothetical protein